MSKKKGIPAENSNNYFKAGWKPTVDFDHTTGEAKLHMQVQTQTTKARQMRYFVVGDLTQNYTKLMEY